MQHPREIKIEEYDYHLPVDRIAKHPLPNRDESKLLIYSGGKIEQTIFSSIDSIIDAGDLLVVNDTRVIPARLFFKKSTGGVIEIFCLEPLEKSHQDAMQEQGSSQWKCMVGGAKKWKNEEPLLGNLSTEESSLFARKIGQEHDYFVVEFYWTPSQLSFSEILEQAGTLPLPPYFDRKTEQEDIVRYQTVFARHEGSVAAPTAGLHFTPALISVLVNKGVQYEKLTLHVGAGTFKPVSSTDMSGHIMHSEVFSVSVLLIRKIAEAKGKIIAVGTTTTRTLESLYWFGVKILQQELLPDAFPSLDQWEVYEMTSHITLGESLDALVKYCEQRDKEFFSGKTSIIIAPGYNFKCCKAIITNFHLPKSTLLLLVSAFIGPDWKKVYDYAQENDFRFLSYGDSSILMP